MTTPSPSKLPGWADEIGTLLPACAHMLVTGNTADIYLVPAPPGTGTGTGPSHLPRSFVEVVQDVLARRGIDLLLNYHITTGVTTLAAGLTDKAEVVVRARAVLGEDPTRLAPPGELDGLAKLVARVGEVGLPVGLVVRGASRLVLDSQSPEPGELRFFRDVDQAARTARPRPPDMRYNPVIWLLDREQDVPTWFAVGNEKLRSIVVPLPNAGDRAAAAAVYIGQLPRRSDATMGGDGTSDDGKSPATVLAEQTAGLTLVAMRSVVGVAADQGLRQEQIEDAARAYRVGILDNPWREDYLSDRLRGELRALAAAESNPDAEPPERGPKALVHRVIGQEAAVRKSLDILVRSVTNMTAAHTPSAQRPRGVLFFAGPTGVGKTELAKGLTKLIFDDDQLYIRFDMSEFSEEQAAERFVGAPPGFVGYERGGELTNAVRRQPFSVVLFDEVEKAHPLVLDKFLQLLDEGRLTDGRGETAHFTESVVVFTSNLGIYREVPKVDENGVRTTQRELNVSLTDDPAVVAQRVAEGITDHFTRRLGRPELLNRIGENIVVFDFIREPTARRITRMMVRNVLDRVRVEHDIDVVLHPAAEKTLMDECLRTETLVMGGRGIGSRIETVLVNPLSSLLFLAGDELGSRAEIVELACRDDVWRAEARALATSGERA
jgi:ATP-dependent Clp protease ATP-binding subunit ClpB